MLLSISNIAWESELDQQVYEIMERLGFSGLEIAPTRIFQENPYENLSAAEGWANELLENYGIKISSMQSIWYGKDEKLFGTEEDKDELLNYTKKAIDFAESVDCINLVFGSPRNRIIPDSKGADESIPFFKEIGDYAYDHNCVIAMEANPRIYNTNYINTTEQALDLIKRVDSNGFLLNLDIGTMIENGESISVLTEKENYIHHVHISEPYLKTIEKRELHFELSELLRRINYKGFVSIEVHRQESVDDIVSMMEYVRDVFG